MMKPKLKGLALSSVAVLLSVTVAGVSAHTRFQTPVIDETNPDSPFASTYNNEVIGHGCDKPSTPEEDVDRASIATSIVFPDNQTPIISNLADGGAKTPIEIDTDGDGNTTIDDVLDAYGNIVGAIQSADVYDKTKLVEKLDENGNVVGFSQFGGRLPGTLRGLVPFTTGRTVINPDACVKSVTLEVWGADICKRTKIAGFNGHTVNIWSVGDVGSDFDGVGLHGFNSPPTLTVNRVSDLPAGCSAPIDVRITPSGVQLNRDAPIKRRNGTQYWPKP